MLEEIKENYGLIQVIFAGILGVILQYLMGNKKGRLTLWLIIISSLFTALMISNIIFAFDGKEILGIDIKITPTSPFIIVGVGLSSLISMEAVALIIHFLPKKLKKSLMVKLDINEDKEL